MFCRFADKIKKNNKAINIKCGINFYINDILLPYTILNNK